MIWLSGGWLHPTGPGRRFVGGKSRILRTYKRILREGVMK